jgi:hypothetical protein
MTQLAQTNINLAPPPGVNIANFTIEGLIQFAIIAILAIAGVIFFFMLILGGIKWIMSGGDKTGTEGARKQITAALIGLIIVFSAWAILNLVNQIFGINILNFQINAVNSLGQP